jgi:RNA polymerase sigma-70 factor (ECF subfamily)
MEERVSADADVEFRTGDPVIWPLPDFDDFYEREFDSVAALAYVLSGSRLASDDLAQEAFLTAYRRWGDIGRYDDPGAWVRRVVANRSASLVRRTFSRTKALIRLGEHLEPAPEMSPDTVDVWRAIRRLPRRQAQVTALYYLDDLSLDDVAAVLDCSVETVRTHLRRARKALARTLDAGDTNDG